jgi:hypothetical protein
VAEAFLTAMAEGDYDKAKKYASAESQEAIDQTAQMSESMEDMGGDEEKDVPEIKVGEATVEGEHASVAYTEDGTDKTLELVKEDGEWKAVFSKMPDMEGLDSFDESLEELEGIGDSLNDAIEEMEESTTE